MERKLYKELWTMRFQKMLQLEEDSIHDYTELLEECKTKYKSKKQLQESLEVLIKDETKHAKLVRELLKIVNAQEN